MTNASAGAGRILTALDPAVVSHTFTIPALGIDVPIAAQTRVTLRSTPAHPASTLGAATTPVAPARWAGAWRWPPGAASWRARSPSRERCKLVERSSDLHLGESRSEGRDGGCKGHRALVHRDGRTGAAQPHAGGIG